MRVHARTLAREIRSPIQILSGLLIGAARLESTAESQSMGITYTHSPKETGSFFIYCCRSKKMSSTLSPALHAVCSKGIFAGWRAVYPARRQRTPLHFCGPASHKDLVNERRACIFYRNTDCSSEVFKIQLVGLKRKKKLSPPKSTYTSVLPLTAKE